MSYQIATGPSSYMQCANFLNRTEPFTKKTFGSLLQEHDGEIYAVALVARTDSKTTSLVDFSELMKRIQKGDSIDPSEQKISAVWISVFEPARGQRSLFIRKITEQELPGAAGFLKLFAAANRGNPAIQMEFALALDSFNNDASVLSYCRSSAEGGHPPAQLVLGQTILAKLKDNRQYREIGIRCLREGIEASNDPHLIHTLGMYFYDSQEPAEKAEAFALFQRASRMEFTESTFMLAYCWLHGVGCDPIPSEAEKHYKIAADQGHVNAAYNYYQSLKLRAEATEDKNEKDCLLEEAQRIYAKHGLNKFDASGLTRTGQLGATVIKK